jgi:hypothetical protein
VNTYQKMPELTPAARSARPSRPAQGHARRLARIYEALALLRKEACRKVMAGRLPFVQSTHVVAVPACSRSATIASVLGRRRAHDVLPSRSLSRGRGVVFLVGDVLARSDLLPRERRLDEACSLTWPDRFCRRIDGLPEP